MSVADKLAALSCSIKGWDSINEFWVEEDEYSKTAFVGAISDGEKYPVASIDCHEYDCPDQMVELAEFYAAANPVAIRELLAETTRLRQQLEIAVGALEKVVAANPTIVMDKPDAFKYIASVDASRKALAQIREMGDV